MTIQPQTPSHGGNLCILLLLLLTTRQLSFQRVGINCPFRLPQGFGWSAISSQGGSIALALPNNVQVGPCGGEQVHLSCNVWLSCSWIASQQENLQDQQRRSGEQNHQPGSLSPDCRLHKSCRKANLLPPGLVCPEDQEHFPGLIIERVRTGVTEHTISRFFKMPLLPQN